MFYIRFLKPPRFIRDREKRSTYITSVITLCSDLGDDFCPRHVTLAATLRLADRDDESLCFENYAWKGHLGMRALAVRLDLTHDLSKASLILCIAAVGGHEQRPSGVVSDELQLLAGVLSAWSTPLSLDCPDETERRVERRITLCNGSTLRLLEDTGESIARHIWDAGLTMVLWVNQCILRQSCPLPRLASHLQPARKKRLHAVELGTGCGIVGIGLAQLMTRWSLHLTDLPDAADIVYANIARSQPAAHSALSFDVLVWDSDLPGRSMGDPLDLILVTDCTYNPDSAPALVKTLNGLLVNSPRALVIVAMKVRHQSEAVFFEEMEKSNLPQRGHVSIPNANSANAHAHTKRVTCANDDEYDDEVTIDIYEFQRD